MKLQLRGVLVRGPGETGGAIGFALIFLVLFASRQKEQKAFKESKEDAAGEAIQEVM